MQPAEAQQLIADHADTRGPIFRTVLTSAAADAKDPAGTVAWLLSDDTRRITGAAVPVDLRILIR